MQVNLAHRRTRQYLASLSLVLVGGCAAMPADRGADEIEQLLVSRGVPRPAWTLAAVEPSLSPPVGQEDEESGAPVTAARAIEIAFQLNSRIREVYAELGLAQADVIEASRLSNPHFGYAELAPEGGGARRITRSFTLGLAEVLLLPARSRLAQGEFERIREQLAAALIDLAAEVEVAWYQYVSAQQAAEMRAAVARAEGASAELAQRLRDAGNLTPRTHALALAAASTARVAAVRAEADSVHARVALSELLGIASRDPWKTPKRLPAPRLDHVPATTLVEDALRDRLDLVASRREVSLLEDAVRVTHRWRWLGAVDVDYERETETDGLQLRGPTLDVELPLFHQNQGSVARAEAELEAARARLVAQELAVRNEIALSLDRLEAAGEIAERYRSELLPQREAVVRRTHEEYDFMLTDAFELLEARREQFDAYDEYLQAVCEYWVTRAELRRAVGGRLPGDGPAEELTLGVDVLLGSPHETGQHPPPEAEPHLHHHGAEP